MFTAPHLIRHPCPELPTLLVSGRNLVSLQLNVAPTGYISPEAMVTGLTVLTKAREPCVEFSESPPQDFRTKEKACDPPMRHVLPALTDL